MDGRTHMALGIATSLAVVQPTSVPACLSTIIGGAIGGLISDIDNPPVRRKYDYSGDEHAWQLGVFTFIFINAILVIDYFMGDGVCSYFIENFGVKTIVSAAFFICTCIFGIIIGCKGSDKNSHSKNGHRTFTHSLLGGLLLCGSMWFLCRPVFFGFTVGFLSHIGIDILNDKDTGVTYFWPIHKRIGLGLVTSDGKFNYVLGSLSILVSIFLSAFFLLRNFVFHPSFDKILEYVSRSITFFGVINIPILECYLVGINMVAFIIYSFDFFLFNRELLFYRGDEYGSTEEFIHTLLLILPLMGGAIGMLFAIIFIMRYNISKSEEDNNTSFFIIPSCLTLVWIFIYLAIRFNLGDHISNVSLSILNLINIPLIYILASYYLIINLITFIIYLKDAKMTNRMTGKELTRLFLGYIGGAAGGYLAMGISGKKVSSYHFTFGLTFMFACHSVLIVLLLTHFI